MMGNPCLQFFNLLGLTASLTDYYFQSFMVT